MESGFTEKRVSPRMCASGKLSCTAYRMSDGDDRRIYDNIIMPAVLLDISMDGMRIKTSVALEERYLMEYKSVYQVSRVALVRWVKKIGDDYHAGLLCM